MILNWIGDTEEAALTVQSASAVEVAIGKSIESLIFNDSDVDWYYKITKATDSAPTITSTNNHGVIKPYVAGSVDPLKLRGFTDAASIWLKAASGSDKAGRILRLLG